MSTFRRYAVQFPLHIPCTVRVQLQASPCVSCNALLPASRFRTGNRADGHCTERLGLTTLGTKGQDEGKQQLGALWYTLTKHEIKQNEMGGAQNVWGR